jgi:tetratricopeptide (TPR) repeat protein
MTRRRRPHRDRPGRRSRSDQAPDPLHLERVLHEFVGGQADPGTPQGQAEDLVAQAFEEDDPRRRTELARQALSLWPDCADAFVLLAEAAANRKEALLLYQQGTEAGERALGPAVFRESAGHFWGVLQTRPYMRARLGLAHALWTAARREEAVQHLQDMLRLNRDDNQGVRYTLAGFLLFLDRDDELAQLLGQYPEEGSAAWAYTRAVLAFRQQGDTPLARQLLEQARRSNRHVPDYLLGRKFPPAELPDYYGPGDESEALVYLSGFLAGWKATPGAVAWLRASDGHKAPTTPPRGPLGFIKAWLNRKLPQEDDVWQAGCRLLPNPLRVAGEKVRPWLVLVVSHSNDLVLAHRVVEEEPVAAHLWQTLLQAMQNPAAGEPHRPTELQVRPDARWESLRRHVEEVGIDLVEDKGLDHLDAVFAEVSEHIAGKAEPGLLDVPGVGPEQVAGFYRAAAFFFRHAPWKKVGYEAAIKVECGKYSGGPWYAVLMGQSGLTTGLALYEDLATLREMWGHPASYEENARQSVGTVVTFEEEIDLPLADVEAAKRHGWEVARPDAYPWVMHKERGLSHRPPLAWELELLEGCLRAAPEFVQRRAQDDPAAEEMTVLVLSGLLTLKLSWLEEGTE